MYYAYNAFQKNILVEINDIESFDFHDIEEISENKDVWAFAYKEDERAKNLICKPVKGRIIRKSYRTEFHEYKKSKQELKDTGVRVYSRYYADTYEEAVAGFNKLLDIRIEELKLEVNRLNELKIGE